MSLDTEEITNTNEAELESSPDLKYELKTQYRLFRRRFSAFLRYYLKKSFINILYVTAEEIPAEYILALQKQYPDKIVKVLTLHTPERENKSTLIEKFEYNIKNSTFTCKLYEYPLSVNNIQVYGIATEGFENLKHNDEIYQFKYLVHFAKCVRLAAKKLKADIIHSENIPFYLGMEFSSEKKSFRLLQTFNHYPLFREIEPFWAAINLADKKSVRRILKNKIIRKNLAALFGIRTQKDSAQIKTCLNYIYKNYEEFRNNVDKEEIVNENILIKRLNDQIRLMFPRAFAQETEMFNPVYYTVKHSDSYVLNSNPEYIPEWLSSAAVLSMGYVNTCKNKVLYPVDNSNFREAKDKNKKYLIKEFESERIQTKFTDQTLFEEDTVNISGYLDYFFRGVLILAPFSRDSSEEQIKMSALAILKCFEQRKNIQVIFNVPKDFNNKYFQSLAEYLNKEKVIQGKWLLIEGKINLPQFTASSDIVLLPDSYMIGIENLLYTSLRNGCVPVVLANGICDESVTDIYDDMNIGCGFKGIHKELDEEEALTDSDLFTNTLLKSLSFHLLNPSGWNRLVHNALDFDSSWNFELIEQYNNIYNDII